MNVKNGFHYVDQISVFYLALNYYFIQAEAAMQGGRKGNFRDRSALSKANRDVQESRRTSQSTTSSDSSR